ncbi:hypothetical protein AVEN_62937-1 [Araneus ventricosus]|uniref:Uncharacterized protein n=1 Tax=Araneus ventricosus TaxID=182803 RepID=A0A4Y2LDR0_ARAVE|nr:hypothetical protein AVEN_62937-1 [Araneus ventricosus]
MNSRNCYKKEGLCFLQHFACSYLSLVFLVSHKCGSFSVYLPDDQKKTLCVVEAVRCYGTPTIITTLLLFILIDHTAITFGTYIYPTWSVAFGWISAMCPIVPILTVVLWALFKEKGNLKQVNYLKFLILITLFSQYLKFEIFD